MTASSKATKTAESKKAEAGKKAGEALNAALAAADPKDGEQPKPKREPAKALDLNEVQGEIVEGGKVRIGVAVFSTPGVESGQYINRTLVIPREWKVVGPAARPANVHVMDVDRPKLTLCMLPTNWTSGIAEYDKDTFITCEPCARRLIAIKQYDAKAHEKRRDEAQKAREAARKALADRKTAEKAKAAAAKAADATKAATKPAKPAGAKSKTAPTGEAPKGETPGDVPKKDSPVVKPDPKPSARKRSTPQRP